jgi:hypothetical protein
MSKSDVIWNDIKNIKVNAFGLPNQKVSDHVVRVEVPDDDAVYLTLKSSGFITSLEAALGYDQFAGISSDVKYELEQTEQYIVVREIKKVDKASNASFQVEQQGNTTVVAAPENAEVLQQQAEVPQQRAGEKPQTAQLGDNVVVSSGQGDE